MVEFKNMKNIKYLDSSSVDKMFPVSFDRNGKNDRVLSEENLIDWMRSIIGNSSDETVNSKYSCLITETFNGTKFLKSSSSDPVPLKFLVGGYYVSLKLTASDFLDNEIGDGDIYAVITESSNDTSFRSIKPANANNFDGDFTPISLCVVAGGEQLNVAPNQYKLHILTKSGEDVLLPQHSLRSGLLIDGGEIL